MKAEISLLEESAEMLHDKFQINLTEKVNGNWLADLINKALSEYAKHLTVIRQKGESHESNDIQSRT